MMRSLSTLMPYFRQQWGRLVALAVMSGMFSAVTVLQPWPMKLLVDYALEETSGFAGWTPAGMIWAAAGATLALFLINVLLDVIVSWTWMATGQGMVYDLAADVFKRLLSVPFPLQRRSVGDCLERLSGDTWCV
ncbi:MAG: ABC transporter ATP-binding protein, partial [Pirellulales bacterium]|nr:ABC transporter ATP-binding protein [Pirellulales bacterium]